MCNRYETPQTRDPRVITIPTDVEWDVASDILVRRLLLKRGPNPNRENLSDKAIRTTVQASTNCTNCVSWPTCSGDLDPAPGQRPVELGTRQLQG